MRLDESTSLPENATTPAPRRPLGDRPGVVRLLIAASVVLTLVTLTLIYRGWVRSWFPTACIQLTAAPGESVEGAQVSVSNGELEEVARVTLDKDAAPVLVGAGVYTVTTRYQGQVHTQQVVVPHRRLVYVPITTRPAADKPDRVIP